MPELSIIVTAYNRARFLKKTIESLLAEKLESVEILVVDDGSDDRCTESITSLPIKILRHSTNLGQAAAQNTGIVESKGSFVAFFDSDDLLYPRGMSSRLAWMKKNSASVVAGTVSDVIDAENRLLGSYWDVFYGGKRYEPDFVNPQYLAEGGQFPAAIWLLMFSRGFLDRVGPFNEALRVCHDNEYWHRLLKFSSVPRIDVPVARLRLHGENLSGRFINGKFEYAPQIRAENLFLKLNRASDART